MSKRTTNQKNVSATRQARFHLPLLLTIAAFILVLFSAFIALTFHLQTSQAQRAISTPSVNQQQVQTPVATAVPTQEPQQASNSAVAVKPTSTPTRVVPVTPTAVPATPTLIASTPQQTQYGVFPLSTGGPIPVPETVLHPTNIARTMLNATLISVYAGSMTQSPQIGILCVLREDLTTGQMHITMYQAPQMRGPLTILAIDKNILTITNSTKAIGTFDINTNQFR